MLEKVREGLDCSFLLVEIWSTSKSGAGWILACVRPKHKDKMGLRGSTAPHLPQA